MILFLNMLSIPFSSIFFFYMCCWVFLLLLSYKFHQPFFFFDVHSQVFFPENIKSFKICSLKTSYFLNTFLCWLHYIFVFHCRDFTTCLISTLPYICTSPHKLCNPLLSDIYNSALGPIPGISKSSWRPCGKLTLKI